ncbi:MAG: nitroreductase [Devosiaceae bacterium]|nr:nitroreductase [Devosiaceae bacterium]
MSKNVELIKYLTTRRSVPLPFLEEPGPGKEDLDLILSIGTRVPDHAKLCPWRLIVIKGDARGQAGEKLAQIAKAHNPELSEKELEVERMQFLPAPLTIGVLSVPVEHEKVVELEQVLSAGNVALNLVHGANALGFAAHWVTRWFAYDPEASTMLGAKGGEQFVAFVHIGTPKMRLEDKPKADLNKLVSNWEA